MDLKERLALIKSICEEILTEEELEQLLKKKKKIVAYDGFEPSGILHVAQGLLRTLTINTLIKAGVSFKMLVADWHAWANNKYGGDLKKIQIAGEYFIEVWKACGLDTKHVEFVWASELLNNREYWKTVMEIARNSSLNRILRTTQIMGRSEKDTLSASQIFYPCMQAADIFHLKVDICQLGMDQRKVNVLARELAPTLGYDKPVAIHHHMLMGLTQPPKGEETVERAIAMKMSKSKPDTSLFMTDSKEEIFRKISHAYCPEGQEKDNPLLEYCKYLIFPKEGSLVIERKPEHGGEVTFKEYFLLVKAYENKEIHPLDLKQAVATSLDSMIFPVREHFRTHAKAKKLKEQVESFQITR